MNDLLLSIITPSKNNYSELVKCVESGVALCTTDVEHIVVDSSSENQKKVALLAEKYPHVTLINDSDANTGKALEIALRLTSGQFVLFLMGDDFILEGAINGLLQKLRNDNECDVVCYSVLINKESKSTTLFHGNLGQSDTGLQLRNALVSPLYLSRMAIKRSVIERIGGIDSSLLIANDRDLFTRLIVNGAKIVHQHEPLFQFNWTKSSLSNSDDAATRVKISEEHIKIANNLIASQKLDEKQLKECFRWRNICELDLLVSSVRLREKSLFLAAFKFTKMLKSAFMVLHILCLAIKKVITYLK